MTGSTNISVEQRQSQRAACPSRHYSQSRKGDEELV